MRTTRRTAGLATTLVVTLVGSAFTTLAAPAGAAPAASQRATGLPVAAPAIPATNSVRGQGLVARTEAASLGRPARGGIGAPPGGPVSFVQPLESSLRREALPGDPDQGYVWLYGGAVGDLNADGNADVVVTVDRYINQMNGHVVVMRGNGDGTFEAPAAYQLTGSLRRIAHGLALADFDGDEDLDVVVAVPASREIQFLANDGSGVLAAPTFTPTNDRPEEVVAADLDGDGALDLVTVNTDDDSISILEGIGDGTFGAPVDHDTGTYPTTAVAADLDGSGGLDVAVGEWSGRRIGLFLSQGGLDYPATATTLPDLSAGVTRLAAGELDGNPGTDIAAAVYNVTVPSGEDCNHCLATLAGNGDGTFTVPAGADFTAIDDVTSAEHHGTLAPPTDLDADGDLDLAIAHLPGDTVTVALNDGGGGWTETTSWSTLTGAPGDLEPNSDNYGPNNGTFREGRLAWPGDFDGDGRPDLAVIGDGARFTDGGVTVLPADPATPGRYLAPELLLLRDDLDSYERTVALTDWNRDGDADVVAGVGYSSQQLAWFEGHGDGTFEAVRTVSLPGPSSLLTVCRANKQIFPGDFDGDGDADLLCRTTAGGYQSAVLYGDGAGGVEQIVALTAGVSTHTYPIGQAVIADLDGDGDADLVNPRNAAADGVTLFVSLNGGAGRTWSDGPQLPIGFAAEVPLAAADVDGDGDRDLVARPDRRVDQAGYVDDRLVLLANHGDGTFAAPVTTASGVPNGAIEMAAGDLDGDGDDDLVAGAGTRGDGGGLYAVLSRGDGTFDPGVQYRTEPYLQVELLDLDGDGNLDVADGNYGFGLEVLRGNGDGTFDLPARFAFGDNRGWAIAFGDVNGDGRPDAAATRTIADSSYQTGTLTSVLLNTSTGIEPGTPPDLTVESVEAPASVTPGTDATIRYTVRNDGGEAEGTWTDQVWLSVDDTWDLDDRLLDSRTRTDLAAEAGYEVEVDVPFDPLLDGDHRLIVRTDARHQLAEDDEADNDTAADPTTLDIPDLAPGATLDVELSDGAVRYAKVPVGAGQKVVVGFDAPVGDVAVVEAVRDRVPVPVRDLVMPEPEATHRALVLPPGDTAGDWFLRLEGRAAAGSGTTVTLAAAELTFGIVAVAPARGSNRGEATITVTGDGFGFDSIVRLVPEGGGPPRTAGDLVRPDSTILFATLDLTGLAVGAYDVEVESGGETARAPGAFTVDGTEPGEFLMYLSLPGRIRAGSKQYFAVTWRNSGGTDMPAPFLALAPEGLEILDPDTGEWTAGVVELIPQVEGGPPGVLPAGAMGYSVFEWRATGSPYALELQSFEADDPTPLDLVGLLEASRPPDLSAAAWNQVAATVAAAVGTTTGSYVRALTDVAFTAAEFGVSLPTRESHRSFLVGQAIHSTPGAPVAGQVLTDDGGPPGPALLSLTPDGGEARDLLSWYDGRFSFWDVTTGSYEVAFEGPGVGGEPIALDVPSADATELDVVVEGVEVRGTVTRAGGGSPTPAVDGADVTVADPATGLSWSSITTSGGHFTFLGLPAGGLEITASADGLAALDVAPLPAGTDPVDVNLELVPEGRITGHVVDTLGRAVADALVSASLVGHTAGSASTLTGPAGEFTFDRLTGGEYDLEAYGSVPVPGAVGGVAVIPVFTADAGTITVDAGGAWHGTVTDADTGLPIADASVVVGGDTPLLDATSDSAGAFALAGVPSGTNPVKVEADGYNVARAEVEVAAGDDEVLDFALAATGSVSGRVLTPVGDGLADVPVQLLATDGSSYQAVTGGGGAFAIDDVVDGEHTLQVAGGWARRTVELGGGVHSVESDLVVDATAVDGLVIDSGGAPLEGAAVALRRDGVVLASTATGADGSYSFNVLAAGDYEVAASAGGGYAHGAVTVAGGEGTVPVADLVIDGVTLRVLVTGADDDPVEGATVAIVPDGEEVVVPLGGTTDADGVVEVSQVMPAGYVVGAAAPGHAAAREVVYVVPSPDPVEVELGLGVPRRVSGRVLDPDGVPVAAARVFATEAAGSSASALTGEDGRFTLDDLGDGTWTLMISDFVHRVEVVTDLEVDGDEDVGDVTLAVGGDTIEGVVTQAGGPAVGALVVALDGSGRLLASSPVGTGGEFGLGSFGDTGPLDLVLLGAAGVPAAALDRVPPATSGLVLDAPASPVLPQVEAVPAGPDGGTFGRSVAHPASLDVGILDKTIKVPTISDLIETWRAGVPRQPVRYVEELLLRQELDRLRGEVDWSCGRHVNAYVKAVTWRHFAETAYLDLDDEYRTYWGELVVVLRPTAVLGAKALTSIASLFVFAAKAGPAAAKLTADYPKYAQFLGRFGDLEVFVEKLQTWLPRFMALGQAGYAAAGNVYNLFTKGLPDFNAYDTLAFWAQAFGMSLYETANDADLTLESLQKAGVKGALKSMVLEVLGPLLAMVDVLADVFAFLDEIVESMRYVQSRADRRENSRRQYETALKRWNEANGRLALAVSRPCEDDDIDPTKKLRMIGSIMQSSDPNGIVGPGGVGDALWLPEEPPLDYTVSFENLGEGSEVVPEGQEKATAPAATVEITSQLDADSDWSSFELGEFGFGNDPAGASGYPGQVFTPAPGAQSFFEERTVTVPVYGTGEDPVEVLLRASASIDADSGVATWRIEVIDPETGEAPVDPLVGFLPPEPADDEGAGQGFASYRVAASPGLATGTDVSAQARIVFDVNDPIDTNTWVNTIDAGGPSASMSALPATSVSPFSVSWSGSDDAGGPAGSGVESFDVFVSVDGGPLVPWLSDTQAPSGQYAGVVGHSYGFAVRAADHVGHVEALPGGPQATTQVVEAPTTTTTTTTTATVPSTTPSTRPRETTTTTTTSPGVGGQDVERRGFVVLAGDGGVFTFGGASFHGSLAGMELNGDPVAILRTPSGGGYYAVTSDGGVFAFGDAAFRGSLGGMRLNTPIVDAALTPSGRGYLLVAADGGVFAFGDAVFRGSMAGEHLNGPVVAVMTTPSGEGYWLVAADGGVFSFGDAEFFGSLGAALCPSCSEETRDEVARQMLGAPIVDAAPNPDGDGYWLVGADGGVFTFGHAGFHGSLGNLSLAAPVVEMAATATGEGYRMVGADGGLFAFGDADYLGTLAGTHLPAPLTGLST